MGVDRFARIARIVGISAALSGSLIVLGRLLGAGTSLDAIPMLKAIKANSALAWASAGMSLMLSVLPHRAAMSNRVMLAAAGLVSMIGLVTVGEYAFQVDLGIDGLLYGSALPGAMARMAPHMAFCFFLLGSALALIDRQSQGRFPSEWLAISSAFIAYLILLGHLYHVPAILTFHSPTSAAATTAVLVLALSGGMLAARANRGMMSVLTSGAAGGVMARRLVPAALLIPPILGWLTALQPWVTSHDAAMSRALWVWSVVVIFTTLIWKNAALLNRVDAERVSGERAARQNQAFLQVIVDNSPAVISAKTLGGRYLLVNRRYHQLMGPAADDIVGKSDFDIFEREAAIAYRELDARAAASDVPIVGEEVLQHADGLKHFLTVKSRLTDANGEVYAVLGIATDITDRKQVESQRTLLLDRERRVREEAEALFDVARTLASERDLEKIVQHVTDAATKLVGAQFGAFFRNKFDERGQGLLLFTLSGAPREAFERFGTPRNTAVFDPTFRGAGPVRSGDIRKDPRYGLNKPFQGMPPGHLPVRSYLAVPVISRNGQVLGGLFFGHGDPDIFDERAERLATGIAAQASVAVDNATLNLTLEESSRRLSDQLNQLRLLAQVTRAIDQRQQLPEIFDVVIRTLEQQLPADFGGVCLHDMDAGSFIVRHVGAKGKAIAEAAGLEQGKRFEVGESALARTLAGELVYEADSKTSVDPLTLALLAGGLNCLVAAPLKIENHILGIIVVARKAPCSFDVTETGFLAQLCDHVALVMQHIELYSDLRRAYDDLRASQQTILQQERLRSLGQLASGIAHDINNAISPAAVYVDSILDHEKTLSPRTRDQLTTVQRAIGDVAETVSRMRAFYRFRESQQELRPVELPAVIGEVLELTRPRWADMPQQEGVVISVDLQIDADLPLVMGSESELRDGLTNLVFNAVDAMPQGGTVTVRAYSRESSAADVLVPAKVFLEVIDDGVGMDAATRDRCLEPFFTTKGERGTGLGLAMVYGMTQRHGAELEIESSIGVGTTVRIVFPARTAPSTSTTNRTRRPGTARRTVRLLVIDDDPMNLASLSDTLISEGHDVEVALGGQSGIDQFRARLATAKFYEAVITDLGMPHVDGRKVAMEIHAMNPGTPIILLTGWGQRLRDEGDIPVGVSRVLSKPARLQELRAALEELVRKAVQ